MYGGDARFHNLPGPRLPANKLIALNWMDKKRKGFFVVIEKKSWKESIPTDSGLGLFYARPMAHLPVSFPTPMTN